MSVGIIDQSKTGAVLTETELVVLEDGERILGFRSNVVGDY